MGRFTGSFDARSEIKNLFRGEYKKQYANDRVLGDESVIEYESDEGFVLFCGSIYSCDKKDVEKSVKSPAQLVSDIYQRYGVEGFRYIDGSFSFIILNDDESLIYRDRHGTGPQVYYSRDYFASHLMNFKKISNFSIQPDIESISSFLKIGYIPSPNTSLKDVYKLPGGFYLLKKGNEQETGNLYSWEYYMENRDSLNISEEEAVLKYNELHLSAIKKRIEGEKSVGLLLSGGYDSAGNIAMLREVYDGPVKSFSIGFKDNPWTELPLAKKLSDIYKSEHYTYEISGEEIFEMPAILQEIGDPFQEGGLMVNYLAMKLVNKDRPSVILGGDGNDQHHGTAGKELGLHWKLKNKHLQPFQNLLKGFSGTGMFNRDNVLFRAGFHNTKILDILKSDQFGFKNTELRKMGFDSKSLGNLRFIPFPEKDIRSFDDFFLAHNYFIDLQQTVNEVILFKASKMASMFGHKLSFPYMDSEIFDFLRKAPRAYKFKGSYEDLASGKGISKYLHKASLEKTLPEVITQRKKQGGFAPLPIFFKNPDQMEVLEKYILSTGIGKYLFRENRVESFIKQYKAHAQKPGYWFWYKQVQAFKMFNLLMLSVWWDLFINDKSAYSIHELMD